MRAVMPTLGFVVAMLFLASLIAAGFTGIIHSEGMEWGARIGFTFRAIEDDAVKTSLFAALLFALAMVVGKLRPKSPPFWLIFIGKVTYWIGAILSAYLIAIVGFAMATAALENDLGASAALGMGRILLAMPGYWILGSGIRYMLCGDQYAEARVPETVAPRYGAPMVAPEWLKRIYGAALRRLYGIG
jgi:hypothetical protein